MLHDLLGPEVNLVDSGGTTAMSLASCLHGASPEPRTHHRIFVTGAAGGFVRTASRILGESYLSIEPVDF